MWISISGCMTGKPDLNRPAFDAAERRLTAQGHFVINPHRFNALFGTPKELAKSFSALYGEIILGGPIRNPAVARAVMDADLAAVRSIADAATATNAAQTADIARMATTNALHEAVTNIEARIDYTESNAVLTNTIINIIMQHIRVEGNTLIFFAD